MSKKIIAMGLSLFLTLSVFSNVAEPVAKVSQGLEDFSVQLFDVIPNVAMQQGVWPEAWIGKVFPSVPPHFGVGLSFGAAELPIAGLNKALSALNEVAGATGASLPTLEDNLVFPTFTADARVGGVFLPFDIGMSFMRLPNLEFDNITFDFLAIGGSLRYAILEDKIIIPAVSVGMGFMYNKGFVQVKVEDSAYVRSDFQTTSIFFEAQVSKKILFLVPFLGFRGLIAESTNDWAWEYNVPFEGYNLGQVEKGTVNRGFGDRFHPQIFGGIGFDVFMFHANLSASYDFVSSIWGANLGLRFQM
jgi:hypothetical protein